MFKRFSVNQIAAAYRNAPLFQADAIPSWRALAERSIYLADKVRRAVRVMECTGQPYESAEDMIKAIREGTLAVSTDHCDHPVWSVGENIAFRLAHDYFGHFSANASFAWDGEQKACEAHAALLPSNCLPAFFTECIGQAAHAVIHGYDNHVQKVAFLEVY